MEIFKESKREQVKSDENPFEDEKVSQEWIRSVEGEEGLLRDNEIYPRLSNWVRKISPDVLVEIGAGQGICSEKCEFDNGRYIGIEPSTHLVERARELYKNNRRDFLIGDAYKLPIKSEIADAIFSVNVWFHLEDLDLASNELARVLKYRGNFFMITANPESFDLWESWYENFTKNGKKIIGKVNTPINPLSKSIFYKHSLQEIREALEKNGLIVRGIESFGSINNVNAFIFIEGIKE